jgi:organic radical activating enzyme
MSKIRVSEIFRSFQCEGLRTGIPSVFVRFYGCNFSCPGFGMPKGQKTTEVDKIAEDVSLYPKYTDLPLVTTGCDSYASWHPAFKHLSPEYSVFELTNAIEATLPNKKWDNNDLVITGGEPFLFRNQQFIAELLQTPSFNTIDSLTFETNGTKKLSSCLTNVLSDWRNKRQPSKEALIFSVSPKLSCSGISQELSIQPEIVKSYEKIGMTYLKFVVATEEDVQEALDTVNLYRAEGFFGPVYLMAVGGTDSVHSLNKKTVAELALKNNVRYSDRLQVSLFGNAWNT